MRKKALLPLVLILVLCWTLPVLAKNDHQNGNNGTNSETTSETATETSSENSAVDISDLEGYQDYVDMVEAYKVMISEVKTNFQAIKSVKNSLDKADRTELKAALKAYKQDAKTINSERKNLLKEQKQNWKDLKKALKAGDAETAQSIFDGMFATRTAINENLEELLTIQDELLAQLDTLSAGSASAGTAGSIGVEIDGTPVQFSDEGPYIDDASRVLVPVRAVLEALGVNVEWEPLNQQAILTRGATTVIFQMDSREYLINSASNTMDTVPVVNGGRILVPVRFAVEPFGAAVDWDDNLNGVIISTGSNDASDASDTSNSNDSNDASEPEYAYVTDDEEDESIIETAGNSVEELFDDPLFEEGDWDLGDDPDLTELVL